MRFPPWLLRIPPWQWAAGIGAAVGVWLLASKEDWPGDQWPGEFGPPPSPSPTGDLGPVDAWADKELADHCGPPQEGAKLFRRWAIAKWGERAGSPENITRACTSGKDEHQEGRAWDLMINNLAHGQEIVDALTAPDDSGEPAALARRAGIMYMIFNKQQWRAYPQGALGRGDWGPYGGEGKSPHTDHVHISFSKVGGAGLTSLYKRIKEELGDVA